MALTTPEVSSVYILSFRDRDSVQISLTIHGQDFDGHYNIRTNTTHLPEEDLAMQGYDAEAIRDGLEDRSLWP